MRDFIFETDILEVGDLIGFYYYVTQEPKQMLAMVLSSGAEIVIKLDDLTIFQIHKTDYTFDKLKFYSFENQEGSRLVCIKRILKLEEII